MSVKTPSKKVATESSEAKEQRIKDLTETVTREVHGRVYETPEYHKTVAHYLYSVDDYHRFRVNILAGVTDMRGGNMAINVERYSASYHIVINSDGVVQTSNPPLPPKPTKKKEEPKVGVGDN